MKKKLFNSKIWNESRNISKEFKIKIDSFKHFVPLSMLPVRLLEIGRENIELTHTNIHKYYVNYIILRI